MSNVMEFYGFQFSTKSHSSPELTNAQKCFKWSLSLFNVLFLIFGCVLTAVGSYALTGSVNELSGVELPRGIIAIGVFIIIISLLGCFSAWKESRVFLGVYFFFLLIFTIILFAVGIAVYSYKNDASKYITSGWIELCDRDRTVPGYVYPSTASICIALQDQYRCCGLKKSIDPVTDFIDTNYPVGSIDRNHTASGNSNAVLPCLSAAARATDTSADKANWYINLPGCLDPVTDSFQSNFVTAGGCGIAFAVIMTCGMIFVCFLMEGIKKKKHLEDIRKLHKKFREAKETEPEDSNLGTGHTAGQTDESYDVDGEEDVEDSTRNQRVGDD